MKTRTVHWVRLRDIEQWLACGWVLVPANAPVHHHDYAFLMEWLCDCQPIIPEKELN
jgi:hypothetical protein